MLETIRIIIVLLVVIIFNLVNKKVFHNGVTITSVILSCLLAMIVYTVLVYMLKKKRKGR